VTYVVTSLTFPDPQSSHIIMVNDVSAPYGISSP